MIPNHDCSRLSYADGSYSCPHLEGGLDKAMLSAGGRHRRSRLGDPMTQSRMREAHGLYGRPSLSRYEAGLQLCSPTPRSSRHIRDPPAKSVSIHTLLGLPPYPASIPSSSIPLWRWHWHWPSLGSTVKCGISSVGYPGRALLTIRLYCLRNRLVIPSEVWGT